ncbi:hydroxyisourate hydrolase [Swaminathania salitolerans]|uniref:5-hydroxyisourate hydrolase n=1 Tax=Swaminathania salitolerans TaxID=182838 RepID=A0A511BUE4_9PROT|nr:hydroxyisourate hydrolase [Swaminathania salitolerans]GBQ16039.1 hypothetical protein AA21291_2389 [Swaminathania salitolerans LMG 21291]GEL01578.1 5-hydroxyisourate hydrolase [Swaminathania salitolerans]
MTTLSTHVLDTTGGYPASDMEVTLLHDDRVLFSGRTDGDGRCPELGALSLDAGVYRLCFGVAPYFRDRGLDQGVPPFLDIVSVDFGMTGTGHYHVPLLVSPFGYSTYRGS